jgi:hypothetical protein
LMMDLRRGNGSAEMIECGPARTLTVDMEKKRPTTTFVAFLLKIGSRSPHAECEEAQKYSRRPLNIHT